MRPRFSGGSCDNVYAPGHPRQEGILAQLQAGENERQHLPTGCHDAEDPCQGIEIHPSAPLFFVERPADLCVNGRGDGASAVG